MAADAISMLLSCIPDRQKIGQFQATVHQLVSRYRYVSTWEFWNERALEGHAESADYEIWCSAFTLRQNRPARAARIAISSLTGWDFLGRISSNAPYVAVTVQS
jgi:hypothetical protein